MTLIIAEAGSCHDGEKKKALELIEIAAECGADACKFQLLGAEQLKGGNVWLNWDWLPDLMEYGRRFDIEVFASVFDEDGIKWLKACGCKSIKFAYSRQALINQMDGGFDNVYYSTDFMGGARKDCINLYCLPVYPVPYEVSFTQCFPYFDGFSSHCMGIEQDLRAIEMGAKVIEKHFQSDTWKSDCPDAKFAIKPSELRRLCNVPKNMYD